LPRRDDTDLPAFLIDEPNLADPDPFVYASLYWSGNGIPPNDLLAASLRKTEQRRRQWPARNSRNNAAGF